MESQLAPCRCRSYNQPELGGDAPEAILFPAAVGAPREMCDRRGVCVDSCIALEILALWRAGVITYGSCCGHNVRPASVIVPPRLVELTCQELKSSPREWLVCWWPLPPGAIRLQSRRVGGES